MHKKRKILKVGPIYHNLYILVVLNYFENYMTPNSLKYRKKYIGGG